MHPVLAIVALIVFVTLLLVLAYGTFGAFFKIIKRSTLDFQKIGSSKTRWLTLMIVSWFCGVSWIVGWIYLSQVHPRFSGTETRWSKMKAEESRKAEIADYAVSDDFRFLHNLAPPYRTNPNGLREIVRTIEYFSDPTGHYDRREWDGMSWTRRVEDHDVRFSQTKQPQPKVKSTAIPRAASKPVNMGSKVVSKLGGELGASPKVADLEILCGLFERKLLTDEEFREAKRRLFSS